MRVVSLKEKVEWCIKNLRCTINGLVVTPNKKQVGGVLGLNASQFSNWLREGEVKPPQLDKLSAMFNFSAYAFSRFTFDGFQQNPHGTALGWTDLIASAVRLGRVMADNPHRGLTLQAAAPIDVDLRPERTVPCFPPDTRICVTIPTVVEGLKVAGWPLMVFQADEIGYDNWLPRFASNEAFEGVTSAPYGGAPLVLPVKPMTIRIQPNAEKKHQVVAVFSRNGFDPGLVSEIGRDMDSEELLPHLEMLASWLGAQDPATYRVVSAAYDVDRNAPRASGA